MKKILLLFQLLLQMLLLPVSVVAMDKLFTEFGSETFIITNGLAAFAARGQQTAKGGMTIFPNPSTEFISVAEIGEPIEQVVIFNLVGKKVKEFRYSKGEHYYVADLPKNLYLVQLLGSEQRVIFTQKLDKR